MGFKETIYVAKPYDHSNLHKVERGAWSVVGNLDSSYGSASSMSTVALTLEALSSWDVGSPEGI